jgi:CRP/FNR family cyclic AMP-dependent transcriptional regulator
MELDLLAKIPLIAQLSRDDLAALAGLLTPRPVAAHQTVCWIGERGNDFYIVQSGHVEVVQPDEEGKEVTVSTVGAGGFFGEISLLDGGPRTATVRTTSDCVLLTLGREHFLKFVQKHPSAAVHMLAELGRRHRELLDMLRRVENANTLMEKRLTTGQRFAETIARNMGSWTFIIAMSLVYGAWVVLNVVLMNTREEWDPYPFSLLSLLVGAISVYAGPIIMMSQSRQSEKDRIRAELEYQVNVKAHYEVMQLHRKIDDLAELVAEVKGAR